MNHVKKQHSEFCEGRVSCPKTGEEECGKAVIWRSDGVTLTVFCFGCNETHNVKEA